MNLLLDRRALLKGAAALGGLALLPSGLLAAPAAPETIDLTVGARTTKLTIWRPAAAPRGVVLFSTGFGGWPERYEAIVGAVVADGYAVLAPLHVDSVRYPGNEKFDGRARFFERVADMRATSAHAAKTFPGIPVAVMGHSFGTLIGLGMGGAYANLMPMRDPSVTAVLGFSSPGAVPGLVRPGAYASLGVPTILVTGTKDLVQGFVTDPADHLQPIEQSPAGDKYALVIQDGSHGLIGDAGTGPFTRAQLAARRFLAAYLPPNAAAKTALAQMTVAPGDRYIVREG
ncbi:alpha/beta hydrolase [Sphingomonas sp. HF-S4]|uniref:Alpha/beta hydrolase n=1 Tax=Sphingomonas agrestis TaxID=3080540 RepID=A0ABU3YBC9_9SPHN|nr:alpha/beta hydrolase [Sphingomonas sp. HF-S4]MDV3458698.1 alpha/beta hydrolase [Sphingomonas sp. HF-S4]